jgi:hypothetical protein
MVSDVEDPVARYLVPHEKRSVRLAVVREVENMKLSYVVSPISPSFSSYRTGKKKLAPLHRYLSPPGRCPTISREGSPGLDQERRDTPSIGFREGSGSSREGGRVETGRQEGDGGRKGAIGKGLARSA